MLGCMFGFYDFVAFSLFIKYAHSRNTTVGVLKMGRFLHAKSIEVRSFMLCHRSPSYINNKCLVLNKVTVVYNMHTQRMVHGFGNEPVPMSSMPAIFLLTLVINHHSSSPRRNFWNLMCWVFRPRSWRRGDDGVVSQAQSCRFVGLAAFPARFRMGKKIKKKNKK